MTDVEKAESLLQFQQHLNYLAQELIMRRGHAVNLNNTDVVKQKQKRLSDVYVQSTGAEDSRF